MRGWMIGMFLLLAGSVFAQNALNQVDVQGRKQGAWTKKDAAGKVLYRATFKDDKPVGEMKRFHANGKLKAVMVFAEGSEESDAKLYDERGVLIAQGKYIGQKKTGEWNYFVGSKVVATETYLNGQKNGVCKRFYQTGELFEESNWKNDKLDGIYRSYFQDGKMNLECNYQNGLRNGKFKTVFPNGSLELDAVFTNDVRDKDWKYFDETGKHCYTLKYNLGELLNPQVQDSVQASKMGTFKKKEDNLPDPEKFMQNPEEYMRLMQNH